MNQIRKQVEESGDKSGSVFDQAKASIDRMFGKKPGEGGGDPGQSPPLLPQGPDPGAAPRSLPTNLGKPN
jgi:hypothetical protein